MYFCINAFLDCIAEVSEMITQCIEYHALARV